MSERRDYEIVRFASPGIGAVMRVTRTIRRWLRIVSVTVATITKADPPKGFWVFKDTEDRYDHSHEVAADRAYATALEMVRERSHWKPDIEPPVARLLNPRDSDR